MQLTFNGEEDIIIDSSVWIQSSHRKHRRALIKKKKMSGKGFKGERESFLVSQLE